MNAGLLEHIRTFVRAVEAGSFTAVAAGQRQSQPTVSRQISALEDHLGVRLLQRTTRALTLTDEGRTYYNHARAILDAVEAAAVEMRSGGAVATGNLRIAAPIAFARLHLMPRMQRFLAAHPTLTTDWVLGDRPIDLVEEGIDVAIRIGRATDQALIARRIGEIRRITVATPEYWQRNGRPNHPEELKSHDCIVYSGLATVDEWHFRGPDGTAHTVKVKGRVRVNASEGVRSAVLEGLGVAVVPTWLLADEIERGILHRVLTEYEPDSLPIQAVTPSRRFVPPRVRAFSDFLASEFRGDPRLSGQLDPADIAKPED